MIGIMQGRLVPPTDGKIQTFPRSNWRKEFPIAQQVGLTFIEWIYDEYGEDVNPLRDDSGIETLRSLSAEHGVQIRSLCADYFMDKPLLRCTPNERNTRLEKLLWLLNQSKNAGINYIILPFVDASRFETQAEIDDFTQIMNHRVIPLAERLEIEIHLESSLPPEAIIDLLGKIPSPFFQMNYDSGNSSSLGYHPDDEFAAYGNRIGSIHIKDRILGGTTVPLGTGSTNFDSVFRNIQEIGYEGPFVLQVARGKSGDEMSWARANRQWLIERLQVSESIKSVI